MGEVCIMGENRNVNTVLVRKPEGKRCLEDLDINVRKIWVLRKQGGWYERSFHSEQGSITCTFEHGIGRCVSQGGREFHDQLNKC